MSLAEVKGLWAAAPGREYTPTSLFARQRRPDHWPPIAPSGKRNRLKRSPAQTFALVIGATLTVAGIVGFLYSSSFGKPGHTDAVLGVLDVNGWHNLFHLLSGLLGLALAGSYPGARRYAIGLGGLYALIALWGIVLGSGESILGIIPVNHEDNVLHALIAVAGLAAGLGTSSTPQPSHVGAGTGLRYRSFR